MKKFVLILFLLATCAINKTFAEELPYNFTNDIKMQSHIDSIGYKLLNANKIDERIMFLYKIKDDKLKGTSELTKRQIIVYDKSIQFAADDSEIAALLSREICKSAESYTGMMKGFVTSAQIMLAPKKFEILFDKRAVDYMVKAGYNPLALITFLHKSCPQKRYDKFGRTNLASKRLAKIYEYIYFKYPTFLQNNEYIDNDTYQNFLLTSIENRKKLQEKIQSNSKKAVKYE